MSTRTILRVVGRITVILAVVAAVAAVVVLVGLVWLMETLSPDDEERERMMIRYRADDLTIEFARLQDTNRQEADYAAAAAAKFGVVLEFQETPNRLEIAVELANSPGEDFSPGELRQCYQFTLVDDEPRVSTYSPIPCATIPVETG